MFPGGAARTTPAARPVRRPRGSFEPLHVHQLVCAHVHKLPAIQPAIDIEENIFLSLSPPLDLRKPGAIWSSPWASFWNKGDRRKVEFHPSNSLRSRAKTPIAAAKLAESGRIKEAGQR